MTTIMSRLIFGFSKASSAPALVEYAEQDRRQNDADRMSAAHQRDRDADEAEACGIFEDEPVLLAEDHVDRQAAGQGAREQRSDDGHARRRNAAVDRRGWIGPDGADLVAEARAPDDKPDGERRRQRQKKRQVERRDRPMNAELGEDLVKLREPGHSRGTGGLRIHLAGDAQDVDQQVAHDGGGDVVEHDRRDDDVAVAVGLQVAGNGGECGAEQGGAEDRGEDESVAWQEAEMEGDERGAEARDVGLPFDADIEEAGVKADRDREPGENETRRVIEREADAFEIAERAGDEDLHRLERILADRQHDETGYDKGGGDVDQRDQRDVGPGRQRLERGAHAARSLTPAIRRPRSWAFVSSGRLSPVIRPPQSTMMRSERAKISSSSTETSRMALPASR